MVYDDTIQNKVDLSKKQLRKLDEITKKFPHGTLVTGSGKEIDIRTPTTPEHYKNLQNILSKDQIEKVHQQVHSRSIHRISSRLGDEYQSLRDALLAKKSKNELKRIIKGIENFRDQKDAQTQAIYQRSMRRIMKPLTNRQRKRIQAFLGSRSNTNHTIFARNNSFVSVFIDRARASTGLGSSYVSPAK